MAGGPAGQLTEDGHQSRPVRGETVADRDGRARLHLAESETGGGQYFILAVRAFGLAAGPMAGFDPAAMDKEFFSDSDWHSILVVNIGHQAGAPEFDRMPRLALEHVLGWA